MHGADHGHPPARRRVGAPLLGMRWRRGLKRIRVWHVPYVLRVRLWLWLRIRVRIWDTVWLSVTGHREGGRPTAVDGRVIHVHDVEGTQGAPAAGPIHLTKLNLKMRLFIHVLVHCRGPDVVFLGRERARVDHLM